MKSPGFNDGDTKQEQKRRGTGTQNQRKTLPHPRNLSTRSVRQTGAISDSELRDTEQVPLLEEGGIEAFVGREVLPYAPDAWFDESSIKIGCEINFNRHFYKPQPLRSLEEIRDDIIALEKETTGLLLTFAQ